MDDGETRDERSVETVDDGETRDERSVETTEGGTSVTGEEVEGRVGPPVSVSGNTADAVPGGSAAGLPGANGRGRRQPTLGLALSCGTARAVAHVGVIKALAEAGIRIDCVAGSSGGSVAAVLLAAGKTIEELEQLALDLRWKDLAAMTLPRLGFLSSQRIGQFIEDSVGDIVFSDLRMPCAVVATNLASGARRVFASGRVSQAVRASCSIPQIFSPCEIDGELYIDGGIVEYLPVETVRLFRPRVVLAVNLGAKRERVRRPRHILQLIMQITTVVSRQNVERSESMADLVVRPDMSAYHPFTLERAEEMLRIGYDEMRRHLPELQTVLRRESTLFGRLTRRLTARL
ncbi:MAG: patatin-like phospholipase family protein [Candidatus Eiseniibacteriota bacterium]